MPIVRSVPRTRSLFRQYPPHPRFNVLRHFRQRRPCIRARIFQPVILRRIVASRKIDRPVQLPPLNLKSNRRSRRKRLAEQRMNPILLQYLHCQRRKLLRIKPRVVPHQHRGPFLLLRQMLRDRPHRQPHIRKRKIIRNQPPPPAGPELYRRRNLCSSHIPRILSALLNSV